MRTQQQLILAFNQACIWNAWFYSAYKASSTVLTFVLFNTLDSALFSLYINTMSMLFLLLLFIDCGFKKSIARFLPEYEKNGIPLRNVVHKLLIFKLLLLFCILPFFAYYMHNTLLFLHVPFNSSIIFLTSILLCSEGIVALLQLIYHAYFLHKQFNSINTIGLLFYTGIALIFCFLLPANNNLFITLLYSKAIINLITILISYIALWLLQKPDHQLIKDNMYDSASIDKQFAIHSALMWISANFKCITERNGLIPLLTYTLGPSTANLFKIANEGALFFYRIALKTIGTNDTMLLTHAKLYQIDIHNAFMHIKQKITFLCTILFVGVVMALIARLIAANDQQTAILFFIMIVGYLIELLLSPYERILEVEQHYKALFMSYVPYIVFIIILLHTNVITYMGLTYTIGTIHAMRLISAAGMAVVYVLKKRMIETEKSILSEENKAII